MKIIWLEDDPKTIRSSINRIEDNLKIDVQICECFAEFSEQLYALEDAKDNIIVIDIRMLFNIEDKFFCFDKEFNVKEELDAGFEYFKECIEKRFSKTKIVFFTSKPLEEAKSDAKNYDIDTNMIITKDDINRLLSFIKGEK